jgi:molybdopterin synthase sulfur carrier subunit
MIRVLLPVHLQRLANTGREVTLQVENSVTPRAILDALEAQYPVLCGTIRDQVTQERRDFIRFFACGEDFSLAGPDVLLPDAIATGADRFMIVGAMAGG